MSGFALPAFFGAGGIGWQEMVLVMLVLLIFFGRRIPEVMRSLGRGVSQFKKGLSEVEDEVRKVTEDHPEDYPKQKPEEKPEEKHSETSVSVEEKPTKQLAEPHPDADVLAQDTVKDEVESEAEAKPEAEANEGRGDLAG